MVIAEKPLGVDGRRATGRANNRARMQRQPLIGKVGPVTVGADLAPAAERGGGDSSSIRSGIAYTSECGDLDDDEMPQLNPFEEDNDEVDDEHAFDHVDLSSATAGIRAKLIGDGTVRMTATSTAQPRRRTARKMKQRHGGIKGEVSLKLKIRKRADMERTLAQLADDETILKRQQRSIMEKLAVVEYARDHGKLAAVRLFNVDEKTVRTWKRKVGLLLKLASHHSSF